jgi:hypothetical protein
MATQVVMDRTGDGRFQHDPNDADGLAEAEKRFRMSIAARFTATVQTSAGRSIRTRSFYQTAEETLFFPCVIGGWNPR